MRKFYEVPSMQIYELDEHEVIVTSGLTPGGDQTLDETGDDYGTLFGM